MTLRTARLLWGALLATPPLFAGVAAAAGPAPAAPGLAGPLFWGAAAAAAVNVALSRLLPPRLPAAGGRDAAAFTRLLVAFALCDAAALAPVVAFLLTRDARLLGLVALALLALALLYPTGARWARLGGPADPAARRTVP